MCTGAEPALLYASLAATAAGTAASIDSQRKTRKASERAASADLLRKQTTAKEAKQIFDTELEASNVGDAQADADAAAALQLQETKNLIDRPAADTGFTTSGEAPAMVAASPVVKEAAARSLADELSKVEGQMRARSTLQGYNQRTMDRGMRFGRANDQMALLGNFNRGWDQVANTEQQMAKFAGAKQAMLGDLLTGVGSMGTAYSTAKGATLFGDAAKASSANATVNPYNVTGPATGKGYDASRTFTNYPVYR